jgi:hypothetical protein
MRGAGAMPVNVSVNDRAIVTAGLATRFLDGYHPPFLPVQRRYQIAQVFGRSRYANQKDDGRADR